MSDKTIRLIVDFTYDTVGMHGDDEDSIEWFYNDVLFGDYLELGEFCDIGETIGSVKVVSVDQTLAELKGDKTMSDWDNLVEPARAALETLIRKGDAAADRIEELEAKLDQAQWLLCDASVQLREGKIKTRRNRANLIDKFLSELKGQDDE